MKDAYSQAGVDIAAGQQATELMKEAVRSTYNENVLSETGAFGGLFSAQRLQKMDAPILVASTDGVGTKTMVASHMGDWTTIGQDLVNHCVNDILVQGAEPLFFLDYVASSKLNPEQIADVVRGCAIACKALGTALLGGETAEMPGVYQTGELDLVGTVVGMVDRSRLLDGSSIEVGDAVLAFPSTGLHTNGYSLARKVLAQFDWKTERDDLGTSIGQALLAIHRCYFNEIRALFDADVPIHGLAHITGGGVYDNLPRIFPDGISAIIRRGTWQEPPIFTLIAETGNIVERDLFHTFNMGLGMLVILPPDQIATAQKIHSDLVHVGDIVAGDGTVVVEGAK